MSLVAHLPIHQFSELGQPLFFFVLRPFGQFLVTTLQIFFQTFEMVGQLRSYAIFLENQFVECKLVESGSVELYLVET